MDHQFVAIIEKAPTGRKRSYKWVFRIPKPEEITNFNKISDYVKSKQEEWERKGFIPNQRIPKGKETRRLLAFGINSWVDLFNPHQLLTHVTLMRNFIKIKKKRLKGKLEGSPEWEFERALMVQLRSKRLA